MRITIISKDKIIETDLFGILLNIFLYKGKEIYARRTLPKRIVIIGRTSINKRTNASAKNMKGTIFLYWLSIFIWVILRIILLQFRQEMQKQNLLCFQNLLQQTDNVLLFLF